jgi:D-beta-D-heptose 7-phosphate kinase / D-beta-D-heptose 1-phosphate adenosyltransferase
MDVRKIEQFGQARVLVVGDIMLDHYILGDSSRISPEAPVPVVKIQREEWRLGGAANVARNIRALDAQVGLVGLIGQDAAGKRLQLALAEEAIVDYVQPCSKPTITKLRVISRQQQVVRLDQEQLFDANDGQELLAAFASALPHFDLVVFSDYAKGTLTLLPQLMAQAKAAGKRVLVDPKSPDFQVYRGADVITPNLAEFRAAGGDSQSEVALADSARRLLAQHQLGAMLLTRSEQGMSVLTATTKVDFPAQVREVSDVTGAGDTVIATLSVLLALGEPLAAAAELANIAAGVVVGKLGTSVVTPEELAAAAMPVLLAKGHHYQTPFDQVVHHVTLARRAGERIVFTNGCFDLLHPGHVQYLEQAKALGDRLVVGINTDASIRRLKGDERPINPLQHRQTMLGALRAVDWVIPFGDDGDDTPLAVIEALKPDVLVKGGDYTIDTIVGARETLARGGSVQVLDFVEGLSTTALIAKIRRV